MYQLVSIVPFQYPEEHTCEAFLSSCMDWRYPDEFEKFVRGVLKIETFDHVKLPGSARAIVDCDINDPDDPVTDALELSIRKHSASAVIIINHADCGKEGGRKNFKDRESERDHHVGLLRRARTKIWCKYGSINVILVYADLTEDKRYIEFNLVD